MDVLLPGCQGFVTLATLLLFLLTKYGAQILKPCPEGASQDSQFSSLVCQKSLALRPVLKISF